MHTLLIDIGNTSIHWRVHKPTSESIRPTFSYRHLRDWETALDKLIATLSNIDIGRILIASVSGQDIQSELTELLQKKLSLTPRFIVSASQRNGVVNGYKEPQQLGVDRWLAVLAGHQLIKQHDYTAALVVDAGTALTVDAVLNYGEHLGGTIIAGWDLQQRTLLQNTQEIMASDGELLVFGKDTASAVAGGAILALVGAISQSLDSLAAGLAEDARLLLVLSGGDAELLESELLDSLDIDIFTADNLVLDGLQLYL